MVGCVLYVFNAPLFHPQMTKRLGCFDDSDHIICMHGSMPLWIKWATWPGPGVSTVSGCLAIDSAPPQGPSKLYSVLPPPQFLANASLKDWPDCDREESLSEWHNLSRPLVLLLHGCSCVALPFRGFVEWTSCWNHLPKVAQALGSERQHFSLLWHRLCSSFQQLFGVLQSTRWYVPWLISCRSWSVYT